MTEPVPVSQQNEFADYQPSESEDNPTLHWSVFREPDVLRAVLVVAAGMALLVQGANSTRRPYVIGASLVVISTAALLRALRGIDNGRTARLHSVFRSTIGFALGTSLVLRPNVTGRALAVTLGVYVAATGAVDLYRWWKHQRHLKHWQWPVTKSTLQMVLGGVIILTPEDLVLLVVIATGVTWVTAGVLAIALSVASGQPAGTAAVAAESLRWLQNRDRETEERQALYEKLFFEGPTAGRQLSRFFILMGFATAISTLGVVGDSTAVVVGAMLIAPLMMPLMGTSASIIMGWPMRAGRSALVVVGGVALAVGLSFVIATWISFDLSLETNTQIVSRVSPTLVDLMIAIAAGGAGAFALSRPDVSDALPGVAVAIALVPPLTVVGITLEATAWSEAVGALLLFTTNAVAILLAGAGVFVLTGLTPVQRVLEQREWIRTTVASVVVLAVIVFGILSAGSDQLEVQTSSLGIAQNVVEDWKTPTLNVFEVGLKGDEVTVVVVGPREPPPVEELADALGAALDHPVRVRVRWVPESVFEASFDG